MAVALFTPATTWAKNAIGVMDSLFKIKRGLVNTKDVVAALGKNLPDAIRHHLEIIGVVPTSYSLSIKFVKLMDRCGALLRRLQVERNACLRDGDFLSEYVHCLTRLEEEWGYELVEADTKSPARIIVMDVLRRMREDMPRVQAIIDKGGRVEPTGAWFDSQPGIGKSKWLKHLAVALEPGGVDPLYMVDPTSQYHNGYTGQPVFAIDDFGAEDNKRVAEVASELIYILSDAEKGMNMASIADKETTFTSSYAVVLSNQPFSKRWAKEPMAFWRRFQSFRVSLDPAYSKNGALDVDKLAALPTDERIKAPHLVFHRYVVGAGDPQLDVRNPLKFRHVYTLLKADRLRKINAGISSKEDLKRVPAVLQEGMEETILEAQTQEN
jgi:hypothetical protein